jgi:hypothetical protein
MLSAMAVSPAYEGRVRAALVRFARAGRANVEADDRDGKAAPLARQRTAARQGIGTQHHGNQAHLMLGPPQEKFLDQPRLPHDA